MELRVPQVRRLPVCISRVDTTHKCLSLFEALGRPRPLIFAHAFCATHAHSPSARSIGFCVIWVCISSSSSSVLGRGSKPLQEPLVIQDRYSFHPGQTEVQVYTADPVTYADLDPKAFMRPENRVLPTSDLKNNSKTAYAKINVSKSQLV